jgi:hypothetical protein
MVYPKAAADLPTLPRAALIHRALKSLCEDRQWAAMGSSDSLTACETVAATSGVARESALHGVY